MDASKISDLNRQAVCRAMHYWAARWNRESPTLFGIELDEFKMLMSGLCSDRSDWSPDITSIANNVLNEVPNGASALSRGEVERTIGISYESAKALLTTIALE